MARYTANMVPIQNATTQEAETYLYYSATAV